ncbi:hypothetical protein [Jannaschia pohangensis]|uniref:hypothetical protein n=1 Tax=Jannaschia pohangensis TaxID=390807 RepID=UPI0011143F86|nr:hypothetical protein [Jannaschia pohangensis]
MTNLLTTRPLLAGLALVLLAACEPPLPDSGSRGAGFDTPAQVAQRREAELRSARAVRQPTTIRPPATPPTPPGAIVPGAPAPLPTPLAAPQTEAERLASETRAALGQSAAAAPTAAPAPLPQSATSASAPDLDRDNPNLSREQDFAAVSAQRDIEADAERLRAARQQYQLVQPTELQRPDSTGPNIFAYALNDARPVGTNGAFRRGLTASSSRSAQKCQGYRSDDIAQEDFLAAGGPERDRLGLDPDGDGNACAWDPAVVRNLVRRQ